MPADHRNAQKTMLPSQGNLQSKVEAQDRLIAKLRRELVLLSRRVGGAQAALKRLSVSRIHADQGCGGCRNSMPQVSLKERMEGRRAKEELKKIEARFRALVESSSDHIFILDEKGTFVFSNDKVDQFDLKVGKELEGKRLQDVYPVQVSGLYRDKMQEVFHRGEVVSFHHHKAAGSSMQHHIDTLFPIRYDGTVRCVGGICHDISEQKRIEKQLFQAQKMESLGTLVAGVAHEINNPINLMLLNLPLFAKMWADIIPLLEPHIPSEQDAKIGGLPYPFVKENLPQLIADMELAAQRVARIITGLKDFSRKSNPAEKTDVQVNQAVKNATRLAASTLKKSNAVLSLNLSKELPLISANLQNLEQIILNLMINALQSIGHSHGEVRIRTMRDRKAHAILIEVADNGRGVNPAVADKIFDPFVTDRQADGGTGLGLSVTYNLVKAHQGDIYFEAQPKGGTTFTVVLPISPRRRLHRIMVVDDDRRFRKLLIDALSEKVHSLVEGFANGAEALIRMGSYPPDLLVLDMFMPEIDGLGVCRAIKNELGMALDKVIIVTGFPEHPNVMEVKQMGFEKIYTKPLEIEDFLHAVKDCLDGDTADQISHYDR